MLYQPLAVLLPAGTSPAPGSNRDESPRKILLITTVDIGEGKSAKIEFRQGDDAVDVARAFVQTHGLPITIINPLAHHIREHLKQTEVS